ncbi:sn-glycerol-1-phosphate dehydrogenase [Flintibacter sp. NSJ-23]|uniref:sn-glycerol-1-phosphate dehydrogenase n=1 Tax=Flintibacter hominis TaxID=2763048 RepID=A0A8J6J1B9_9FIRM|nr:sn-glycerol-1-phosphate dehydrogenase [Flintibacter hominis]MBC5723691.1 sn-glycerol-1-phosphate dehydrogenase [Flintibacter hominis]
MELYHTPHGLNDYLNRTFTCPCGKTHSAPLKYVSVRKDALSDLPKFVKELGFHSLYLVSDHITYGIAGQKCMDILARAGIRAEIIQLTHLEFDEATLGELVIHMPQDCDLVVAVGTGTINDMTRYFSFKLGRPFFTVATAAPMDGFASSIAAIHVNHLKTTFQAQTPLAVIGDTEILKNAPYPMIAAGLGDLLGKCTCLCDWRLSHIITGEHQCERIMELVEKCVQDLLPVAGRAKERDPKVLGDIMEGLVLTGVAMSLYGNSRPASGCEHHMSHYWETILEQRGQRPAPHGAQVGVGTVLVLKAVELLLERKVDFDAARRAAEAYDPVKWREEIQRAYGPAAPGVIEMEEEAGKNASAGRLARIDTMERRWSEISALLRTLPTSDYVADLLSGLGAPCRPEGIGIDRKLLKDTFLYCKEIRARYTILQMMWDLDLLDSISDQVIEEIG